MRITLAFLAALLLALTSCAAAPGRIVISDTTEQLDRALVEAAAAPLVERGAVVSVFLTARGDDTGVDFQERLDTAGLLQGGQTARDVIALYVSFEPRYSELRAGTNWSDALPDATLREVREGFLNPALRDDQAGAGVAATLAALEERIAHPSLGARIEQIGSWFVYTLMAAGVLVLLAFSSLGERIRHWWRRSPPGRLGQWLIDRTPGGRKRIERITRATLLRLEDRADFARSSCQGAATTPAGPGLMNRLKILDQKRAALMGGAAWGSGFEEALDKLAWDYTYLGHEASGLTPPKPAPKSKGKRKRGGASAAAASAAFTAGAAESYTSSSSSDSSSTWDSGSSYDSSGPSSDGGSW